MTVQSVTAGPGELLHDCNVEGCGVGRHQGFRYWLYQDDLALPLAAPYTAAPAGWPAREAIHAVCAFYDHEAPYPGCSCGIRVTTDMASLAAVALMESRKQEGVWWHVEFYGEEYARQVHAPKRVRSPHGNHSAVLDRLVLGDVPIWGRMLDGDPNDPRSVIRVQHSGIHHETGVLHVPRPLAEHARRIEDIYGAKVVVHETVGHRFLASFLSPAGRKVCQACRSGRNLRDGLCAEWKGCCNRLANRIISGERP